VVALGVDDERAQHLAHLGLDLGLQLLELTVLDVAGDVVIGVVAALRADEAVANAVGGGQVRVVFARFSGRSQQRCELFD
jgi:hypothetical protein